MEEHAGEDPVTLAQGVLEEKGGDEAHLGHHLGGPKKELQEKGGHVQDHQGPDHQGGAARGVDVVQGDHRGGPWR